MPPLSFLLRRRRSALAASQHHHHDHNHPPPHQPQPDHHDDQDLRRKIRGAGSRCSPRGSIAHRLLGANPTDPQTTRQRTHPTTLIIVLDTACFCPLFPCSVPKRKYPMSQTEALSDEGIHRTGSPIQRNTLSQLMDPQHDLFFAKLTIKISKPALLIDCEGEKEGFKYTGA